MKNTAFLDVMSCSLVEFYWRLDGTYGLHLQARRVSQGKQRSLFQLAFPEFGLLFDPDDGGSIFLRNAIKLLPYYISASHPWI
jgi:hypothetical protein